jgi:beta-N-acetylhexosaminidase
MRYFISIIVTCFFISFSSAEAKKLQPSLRDKIGQMLLIGFNGKQINAKSTIVKNIQKFNLGGVILFDYNYQTKTFDKNIESVEQVKKLNKDLKNFARIGNKKHHRPDLDLLISVDYEGGEVTRLQETYGFPATFSAYELGQRGYEQAQQSAQAMAATLKQVGFNLDFAPVLDLNSNPSNPIIGKKGRSFSSDPEEVTHFAQIFTQAFRKSQIQCAYKHFPGHGSSTGDSHLGFVDVSDTWRPSELIPYQQLLNSSKNCGMVMTAHIVNRQLDPSGLPATLSPVILNDLLRKQLHFKGVIITDDMQMKAISAHYGLEEALERAINAGADMLTFGNNLTIPEQDPQEIIDIIAAKVKEGKIKEERINQAYAHILRLKKSLGR